MLAPSPTNPMEEEEEEEEDEPFSGVNNEELSELGLEILNLLNDLLCNSS